MHLTKHSIHSANSPSPVYERPSSGFPTGSLRIQQCILQPVVTSWPCLPTRFQPTHREERLGRLPRMACQEVPRGEKLRVSSLLFRFYNLVHGGGAAIRNKIVYRGCCTFVEAGRGLSPVLEFFCGISTLEGVSSLVFDA